MTDEQLQQIEQWYADPVRILPRKIVADVTALVAEVRRLRAQPGLIGMDLAKQMVKTPAGAGAIVGAVIGGLLGSGLLGTSAAKASASPLRAPGTKLDWNQLADKIDGLCAAEFIRSADYKGSPTDAVTDADIRCTKPKGHDGLHRHEPWAKDFR